VVCRARSAPIAVGAVLLLVALSTPRPAAADLRIHVEGAASAPLDQVLRDVGPGFTVGGSIDYEVVNLLAVGVYYAFTDFIISGPWAADEEHCRDCRFIFTGGNPLDHAVGARLDLRFVRHRIASWFGTSERRAYGEAFLELDLAYHNTMTQSRVGWGLGLGYRVIAAGPFGIGPYFRFVHIVSDIADDDGNVYHQFYVSIGLTMFLSFDLTRGHGDDQPSDTNQDEDQGNPSGEDEWSGFEPVAPSEEGGGGGE
jgi:hypothetical protein